jgi:hypothetical protein
MSVSQIPAGTIYQEIDAVKGFPLRAGALMESGGLTALKQSGVQPGQISFVGRIVMPGIFSLPEQSFTIRFAKTGFVIGGSPSDSWPQLVMECQNGPSAEHYLVTDFLFRLAEDTVESWLRQTCTVWSLEKAGRFCIETKELGVVFEVEYELLTESEQEILRQMSKLIRKLKYIETVFNVNFSVPDQFSRLEVQLVEILYRGLTEGTFTILAPNWTFSNIPSSGLDLHKPPFDGPGSFSTRVGHTVRIFGKQLDVGPVTVSLNKAEIAKIAVAENSKKRSAKTLELRFEVLDQQVKYRFETYALQRRNQRVQRLKRFKHDLARSEPIELAGLIDESLQDDVSAEQATQIAVGLTQYYDLPDRYYPQRPELEPAAGRWRVPIYLVCANGEGGPVGEVVIEKKSGVIVSHTPVDELRSKGRALAEHILHA